MSATARLSVVDLPSVIVEDPTLRSPDDLTVQIHQDDGAWHRRAVGGLRTGCGDPIGHSERHALRHETYEGHLCTRGCFSSWELSESARLNAARDQDPQK